MRLSEAIRTLTVLPLLLALGCTPTIEPVATVIGPEGGVVEAEGVKLDIPAGALASEVEIKVSSANASAPEGVSAHSPFFSFEPAGTTFASPVTVTFALATVPEGARVYWTKAGGADGWDALATTVVEGGVRAEVSHFSTGFVGTAEATNSGPLDCDAMETIDGKMVARDVKFSIGARTARFSTINFCGRRSLNAEANYVELSQSWVDEARVGTDEFLWSSGIVAMNLLTGADSLRAGTFPVVGQPNGPDDYKTPGIHGGIGIKPDPLASALVDMWLLESGSVTVVEHPRAEQGRCFEVKFSGVVVREEKGAGTLPLNGSIACVTRD